MPHPPTMTANGRRRTSEDIPLPGVIEDESDPTGLLVALPDDFQRYDRVRYLLVPPSWCTSCTVKTWRYSEALGAWFEDPNAGGTFTDNAVVVQDVLGDRLAMTITGITGTAPEAPAGGVAYDAEDLIQRCARAYLVGA